MTLFINSCVREESRTLILAKHLLEKLGGECDELVLEKENIAPLNGKTLAERDSFIAEGKLDADMLKYARQFAHADTIVIAAPYWDLGFPALLKSYLEAITVTGITFRYESGIPVGMCKAKKLYYVTTVGGPVFADFGYEYVKAMANGYYGIGETHCFKAENLDIWGADTIAIMEKAKKDIDNHFSE